LRSEQIVQLSHAIRSTVYVKVTFGKVTFGKVTFGSIQGGKVTEQHNECYISGKDS